MHLGKSLEKRAAALKASTNIRDQYKAKGIEEALQAYSEILEVELQLSTLRCEAGSMCYQWEDEWNDDRRTLYHNNKQDTARLGAYLTSLTSKFEKAL